MPRSTLTVIALVALTAFVVLALTVGHGQGPYEFEVPASNWLGRILAVSTWADLSKFLAVPLVVAALLASVAVGIANRAPIRILAFAVLAGGALLTSEYIAKPLVHRTFYDELTFPSGNVTAVSATAFAMWLALYPLLGKRGRFAALVFGVAGTVVMAVAVVGGLWHTLLDDVGSVLLSVGFVAGGAAIFDETLARRGAVSSEEPPMAGKRR